jgi:hypothetical protein
VLRINFISNWLSESCVLFWILWGSDIDFELKKRADYLNFWIKWTKSKHLFNIVQVIFQWLFLDDLFYFLRSMIFQRKFLGSLVVEILGIYPNHSWFFSCYYTAIPVNGAALLVERNNCWALLLFVSNSFSSLFILSSVALFSCVPCWVHRVLQALPLLACICKQS